MSGKRVLLVDDDRMIRFALRDYFERAGFDVSEAEDCGGAREVLRREIPHAIILDHHLPDGVSLDLVPGVIALDAGINIVILTGHATRELRTEALRLGVAQVFAKPVDLPELHAAIDDLIAKSRRTV